MIQITTVRDLASSSSELLNATRLFTFATWNHAQSTWGIATRWHLGPVATGWPQGQGKGC